MSQYASSTYNRKFLRGNYGLHYKNGSRFTNPWNESISPMSTCSTCFKFKTENPYILVILNVFRKIRRMIDLLERVRDFSKRWKNISLPKWWQKRWRFKIEPIITRVYEPERHLKRKSGSLSCLWNWATHYKSWWIQVHFLMCESTRRVSMVLKFYKGKSSH